MRASAAELQGLVPRTIQAGVVHERLKAGHANEALPDVGVPVALAAQAALAVVHVHACGTCSHLHISSGSLMPNLHDTCPVACFRNMDVPGTS